MSVLVLLLACAPGDPSTDAPPAMVFEELVYALEVDWSGAAEVGGARVFTTDEGWGVALTELRVATTTLSLIECADTGLARGGGPAPLGPWTLLPAAYASHPAYDPDPSALSVELVEDLLLGEVSELGPAPSSGAVYCELYLVQGPVASQTLRAAGWLRAPGGAPEPFEVETSLAASARPALDEGRWAEDLDGGEARVTLARRPALALDGLSLEGLADVELAFALAEGLAATATVSWELGRW